MTIETKQLDQHKEACWRYIDINMHYQTQANNLKTGKTRIECTIKYLARFGVTCPRFIAWIYDISRPLALEHLNKLVKENLIVCVHTHRCVDNRAYALAHSGAKFAEQLLSQQLHFRSQSNSQMMVNQNTLMHDLICQFVIAMGLHQRDKFNNPKPLWNGFVTEKEFQRIYADNAIRNVDGLVKEPNGTLVALDIEHSYKNKASRAIILQKYAQGLTGGIYDKVFLVSQDTRIFDDIKRFHEQLFEELPKRFDKKRGRPFLTLEEVDLLQERIIYRTKFCDAIQQMFYS